MTATLFPTWKEIVVFGHDGPQPQTLLETEKSRAVIAGLEPGQKIPVHPEGPAIYHFLEGNGWMIVDGERLRIQSGATVVTPAGAARGMEAETRLVFLGVRVA